MGVVMLNYEQEVQEQMFHFKNEFRRMPEYLIVDSDTLMELKHGGVYAKFEITEQGDKFMGLRVAVLHAYDAKKTLEVR